MEVSLYHVHDNRFNVRALVIVEYINAHLAESHEGPHTDPTHDENIDPMLCQKIHRNHAPALDMFLVRQGGDIFNFSVFDIHKGKYVAMSEMAGPGAAKAPFSV
jgi:hypothetical protein